MTITFDSEDIDFPEIDIEKVSSWIKNVAKEHNRIVGELSYLFCNDEQILEANNLYLQHDYYTDIITFDYSEEDKISGDILISLDTVRSNSEKYKTEYKEELLRVIIHGVLHLCGINDITENEAMNMEEAENTALRQLGYK